MMKKTPQKIVTQARLLFNKMGVSNVRLQDIAQHCNISPGNLSYHYSTKKDLMQAVLKMLTQDYRDMSADNMTYLEQEEYPSVIKKYLGFQIGHRFFYRDTLDIINLVPEARDMYENQMNQVINFTKNGMYLAIGKGFIKPEPHERHYHFFAKNTWAILNSWLAEREVLGENKVAMDQVMLAIWEFHYPYLTKKGIAVFNSVRKQIPKLVQEEIELEGNI